MLFNKVNGIFFDLVGHQSHNSQDIALLFAKQLEL